MGRRVLVWCMCPSLSKVDFLEETAVQLPSEVEEGETVCARQKGGCTQGATGRTAWHLQGAGRSGAAAHIGFSTVSAVPSVMPLTWR